MQSRVILSFVTILVGLSISACVEARYRWNSEHVYITEWTHLSAADREEVLQLFSRASRQPIIGITAHDDSQNGFRQLTIISGFDEPSGVNPWREYLLEKGPGGWRIVASGPIGTTISGLVLSTRPSQSDQKKPKPAKTSRPSRVPASVKGPRSAE